MKFHVQSRLPSFGFTLFPLNSCSQSSVSAPRFMRLSVTWTASRALIKGDVKKASTFIFDRPAESNSSSRLPFSARESVWYSGSPCRIIRICIVTSITLTVNDAQSLLNTITPYKSCQYIYEKSFKEEAVRLSDDIGVKQAAARFGIPHWTLADWRAPHPRAMHCWPANR